MVEHARWLTPPAPAAIALLVCPGHAGLLDVPLPGPGRARYGHLLDATGAVVDEVVALGEDDGGLLLCTHAGPGLRAAVDAALTSHGIGIVADPPSSDRWARLARAPSPAARDWLLADRGEPPFAVHLLERPPLVLITGPPNAGKSSLLNAWCGHRRAVVSAIAGTTRDLVAAVVLHRGWRLRVVDSAGIRRTSDPLEQAGQELVAAIRAVADVVIRLDPGCGPAAAADELVLAGKVDLRPGYPPGLVWAIPERVGPQRAEAMLQSLGDAVLARLRLP